MSGVQKGSIVRLAMSFLDRAAVAPGDVLGKKQLWLPNGPREGFLWFR